MKESVIYSIGHGRKPVETLINELKSFEIVHLCDVRSIPFSRFNPQYNQKALKETLEKYGITYVDLGKQLGGRPTDNDCYVDGNISYEKVAAKESFLEGIQRLLAANEKGIRIAIMCSESKPEECHRSRLIGRTLLELNIPIKHIIAEDRTISQDELKFPQPKRTAKRKDS